MVDRTPPAGAGEKRRFLEWLGPQIADRRVIAAFDRVPREYFVPDEWRGQAYADNPLPIGGNQTISQPLMVALQTEALQLRPDDRVLELGTGSGYQTAILAELAAQVVTVERLADLRERAAAILTRLGYRNVEVHAARDDVLGWPEGAPYDGIIVTAAAPRVPESLVAQLAIGGQLVIPVGTRAEQLLTRVTRTEAGARTEHLGGCRFVPLIGPDAWPNDEPADGGASWWL